MSRRMEFQDLPNGYVPALLGMDRYLRTTSLGRPLATLIKAHVSALNRCAFCTDLHWQEARDAGHDERKLALLATWREVPLFTERERSALGLAEALTRLSTDEAIAAAWTAARRHFSMDQAADLCLAVAETNAWNRVARGCGFSLPIAASVGK